MMYSMKSLVLALCIMAGSLPYLAHGQAIVSPMLLDYKAEARSIETDTITITNTSSAKIDIFPTVNNISVGENGGIEAFLSPIESDRTSSLASWLEISRAPLEIMPGASTTISLTLRVNPNPEPGTYHALVSFPSGSNRDEAEAAVQRGGIPGVIVNVTIEDTTTELMSLSKFSVNRFVTTPDNQAVQYFVENTGDMETIPTGDILVYNQRGEEVASIPVNPDRQILQAGESQTFTAGMPLAGLLGKYKAYLSVQYGSTQRAQLQDTAYFYAIPWKKLAVLFAGLILVAIALALIVHRRYARDEEVDDSDPLPLHIRDSVSQAAHHDIDMKPRI